MKNSSVTRRTAVRFMALGLGIFTLAGISAVSAPAPSFAQGAGDLVVSPTRVVLEGRTRSAALSVVNRGSKTATFRISVINLNMTENGQYEEVAKPDPDGNYADKLFRFSPRRVVLEPGASQAIRILLRKPADLAPGEYRSHMFIRGVPQNVAGRSIERAAPADGNVSIQLQPIYGVTLPIIVRHGTLDTKVALADTEVLPVDGNNTLPRLRLRLNRTGSQSSFGDVRVTYVPNGGGQATVIGELNRLAVYTPNASRVVEVRLRVPDGVKLANGKLDIAYQNSGPGQNEVIAQTSHPLP